MTQTVTGSTPRTRTATVAALVVAVSIAHWSTPVGHDHLLVVHTALGKLYVLPVVLAAIWFNLSCAMATAAAVTLLFLPHIIWQWAGDRTENVNQIGEIVTIWVTAVLSGVFAGREKGALRQLASAYEGIVEALVAALDTREHDTQRHSQRVRAYTIRLAEELGVAPTQKRLYALAALLHDIGKIGIPDAILLKPGRLDEREMECMRRHPALGKRILDRAAFLRDIADIVYAHHERFDGRGYPAGTTGQNIPHGARVFAVADVFDALTSERPYRTPGKLEEARDEIAKMSGTHFDPEVAAAFLRVPAEEWRKLRAGIEKVEPTPVPRDNHGGMSSGTA